MFITRLRRYCPLSSANLCCFTCQYFSSCPLTCDQASLFFSDRRLAVLRRGFLDNQITFHTLKETGNRQLLAETEPLFISFKLSPVPLGSTSYKVFVRTCYARFRGILLSLVKTAEIAISLFSSSVRSV